MPVASGQGASAFYTNTYVSFSVHIFRVNVEKTRVIIRLVNNVLVVLVLLIGGVVTKCIL
jgi:hypothetical protein